MSAKKLSLLQATLMGVAGNAPTYSIAVTSAALTAAVGLGAPVAILVCGVVILGILFAYARLNVEQPNCGAAYTWVSKVLHPIAGFFAGWCLIMAALLFMIAATLPAAKATLLIVAPSYVDNQWAITGIAIFWLAILTALVARGVELLGRVQALLTLIELVLIVVIAVAVLWNANVEDYRQLLTGFSLTIWTPQAIAKGLVVALFFYWGWDVIFNLAEETVDSQRVSMRAGLIAVLTLNVIFTFFSGAVAILLATTELEAGGGNAIFALADKLLPKPWSYIAVLTFLLSVIGGMESSIVLFSRTALAKARDRRLWSGFGRLHVRWETPVLAVVAGSGIVLALLLFSAAFESVEKVMNAGIGATSIMVAIYYGLAGLACSVFFYRKKNTTLGDRLVFVIWPGLSALVFFACAMIALDDMDGLTRLAVCVSLLIGAMVMLFHRGAMRRGQH